ncbi:hypothetical protein AGOR_G00204010 [Albula goreensis]|uniref:Uncharacterized protein n=1 Tax=Albula goreensis TaxID=1534307 RepID=A0A8T3CS83_9TELE|nr:hypothetical protein AGOR_G00204010 [Albula goreensis]
MRRTVAVSSIDLPLADSPSSSAVQSVDNFVLDPLFIVIQNGKVFSYGGDSEQPTEDGKRRRVSTPVAFTKLDGCRLGCLAQLITTARGHLVDSAAACWNAGLVDGHAGRRAERGLIITLWAAPAPFTTH